MSRSLALTLVLLASSGVAHAGPLEQLVQVLQHPAAPQRIAVRYRYAGGGLLVSNDAGATFALLPGSAYGLSRDTAKGAMAGDGTLLMASFDGLLQDDTTSCNWSRDPTLQGKWVSDLVAHPTDPTQSFAVTSLPDPMPNGIYRRSGSAPFVPQGSFEPVFIDRLIVTPLRSGQLRFWESIVRSPTPVDVDAGAQQLLPDYAIRYSDDGGEHWIEHALESTRDELQLEGVDPTDPDRIVISRQRTNQGASLLVSLDAGATFQPYFELASFGALEILPDGRVFIGDAGQPTGGGQRGLFRAASLASPPELLSDAFPVRCLGYRASDATLLACDNFRFGTLSLDGATFTPTLRFVAVDALLQCPGDDLQARCKPQLLNGYCGASHFPCAPVCDAYDLDLSYLDKQAESDPEIRSCLQRRHPEADAGSVLGSDAGFESSPPLAPDAGQEPPPLPPAPAGCQVASPGARR